MIRDHLDELIESARKPRASGDDPRSNRKEHSNER